MEVVDGMRQALAFASAEQKTPEDVRREPARRPDAVRMAAALERLPATARPPFPRVLRGLPPSQSIREDIHVAGLRGLQGVSSAELDYLPAALSDFWNMDHSVLPGLH